jgi:hypothetical protein
MITPKSYLKDTLKDWGSTFLTFALWLIGCIVAAIALLWFVSIVRYWFIPIAITVGAIIGIAIECHDRYERDKALAKNQMSRAGNPMWIRGANSFTSRDEAVEDRDQVMNEMQIAWEKYVSKYGEDEDALLQRDYNTRVVKKINDMIDEGEWE